ncbi:MAG TPA: hypothetical protein V6D48_15270 [Oculatellaceae cyanobacterium]
MNTQKLPKLENLPQRNRWTHRATAQYLRSSRNTVKLYAEQIAPAIRDFYDDCPKDERGFISSGFSFSQYQFWVIVKLISYARLLKADLNGAAYRDDLKKAIGANQRYLSKASYQYEIEMAEQQSA